MWRLLNKRIKAWLRLQLNNNPILFDTPNYFSKLGHAAQVWLVALVVLFAIAFIGCGIVIVGSLRSWF